MGVALCWVEGMLGLCVVNFMSEFIQARYTSCISLYRRLFLHHWRSLNFRENCKKTAAQHRPSECLP